ncbi:DUF1287 domain-containing protein [Bifidobacterium sp.]|jgi:uncharacterized protein YijF (DUF1287 family)|uniref:DUF1287 domain-containing protein n=1 Tax=Bifidobacterium sp. TaxID=41200 RepID=UPI0025BFBD5C|nr:DUF1287 domain-containing protein [Bifidobacterium sp.]MCH4209246.1 DUF1287 domain-containing protein [Bifidobacterium sp.]MCI1224643.1 DUF1287 domain-containing protein [Bifidobacterium sp.]
MGAIDATGAPAGAAQTYTGPAIAKLTSPADSDHDGIDDCTDILQGAKLDAKVHPAYDAGCYRGGYPPANRGACIDVVWRAFKNAGYDLKDMVDANQENDYLAFRSRMAVTAHCRFDVSRVPSGVLKPWRF